VAHATADHLRTAAQRHQIVISSDAILSSAAADAMQELVEAINASGAKALSTILKSGAISGERLRLHLSLSDLAKLLNLPTQELDKNLCKIDVPFAIRRRGVEMVLSNEFELVSARTEFLPLNQHKVGATRPERRRGLV
jgi:hypothetical protein